MADSDVEKIKDRLSIVDVVGQYVKLKKAGRNWSGLCPFHKERTPSFTVSPERGTYICFGCGEKGDAFSFVEKIEGVDFPTALRQLAQKAGVTLTPRALAPGAPKDKAKEERLFAVCEAATTFFEHELSKRADIKEYLHSRGVKDETIALWRLGYAPAAWEEISKRLLAQGFSKDEIVDAGFAVRSEKKQGEIFDRFRGRIIFPLFDASGRVIAVSGRFFEKVEGSKTEGEPAKYVNSPETLIFKKSRALYGFDKAKNYIRTLNCILLVEGQFDLILAHQSGLPFTVALSGTALTPEHLSLLGRLSKRLVLALDADAAGIRAGLKSAVAAFKSGFDVKIPTFPQGKDPADLARENPELLKAAVRTSKTAVEFFLDVLRQSTRDDRAYKKAVEAQVLPLVAAIDSKIDQVHFIFLVARQLSVPEAAVAAEVAKLPQLRGETDNAQAPVAPVELELSALDRKAGMLLAYFTRNSGVGERLVAALGAQKTQEIEEKVRERMEEFRFRFETEVGEHATPEVIAEDMLAAIEKATEKERFKMKFL